MKHRSKQSHKKRLLQLIAGRRQAMHNAARAEHEHEMSNGERGHTKGFWQQAVRDYDRQIQASQ